ncbi:Centrosomal spindle body, CEP44-domain-containing protein [Ochromonadaceae sp. CCMP2298]|nr:Centrosomal spindle body, CEP44-domain-containing protein [Ochromonadaceae sp. CCMP2298]
MSDINNSYETLDRALKKIGLVLVDDHGLLRAGKPTACLDLLRRLMLHSSPLVAKQMLMRGCPSHSADKRLIAAAFELARDKAKYSPSITVDQYLREGFASHKIGLLVKLSAHLLSADKTFTKAPPAKAMYIVPAGTPKSQGTGKESVRALIEEVVQMQLRKVTDDVTDVTDALQRVTDVTDALEHRVTDMVESRLAIAVQEVTTKYDFIINKLVAAVDAEFTLMNNKLAMQGQA